jgi:hypothetical protein
LFQSKRKEGHKKRLSLTGFVEKYQTRVVTPGFTKKEVGVTARININIFSQKFQGFFGVVE